MPELPEVETVLHGLKPHLEGATIQDVIVRQARLRWPVPPDLKHCLIQQRIGTLVRRGKYLLMPVGTGTLIMHLGMSGSLRLVLRDTSPGLHDHVDIVFSDTHLLRYTDPRRFGAILWTDDEAMQHRLLSSLGPEPLEPGFNAEYLHHSIKNRRIAIKSYIMDSHVVVGVGNIYAAEALFLAKIHPAMPAGQLSETACMQLVQSIQLVLQQAIQQGGTTIKDFVSSSGKPGYFTQQLNVYGRAGLPCNQCSLPLQSIKLGQRTTVFCPHCQYC